LWDRLGHTRTLAHEPFPVADPALLVDEVIELPVQVNGKVRSRILVAADADDIAVESAALDDAKVRTALDGAEPRKVIVVPGRMVNVVT
jgi:leucyl-tRNA synthetase